MQTEDVNVSETQGDVVHTTCVNMYRRYRVGHAERLVMQNVFFIASFQLQIQSLARLNFHSRLGSQQLTRTNKIKDIDVMSVMM